MVRYKKNRKLKTSSVSKKNKGKNLRNWRVIKNISLNMQDSVNETTDHINSVEDEIMGNDGGVYYENSNESVNNEQLKISGYRIIQFEYFLKQLQIINNHKPFDCGLNDMYIISEKKTGFRSSFKFYCKVCNMTKIIYTEPVEKEKLDINVSAVSATNVAGVGFSTLEEIVTGMDIPCMSGSTFIKYQNSLSQLWNEELNNEIKEGGKVASEAAIKRGDIDKNNVPLLTVTADGTWGKRSFGRNFSSLSGAAAIIDYHTKSLLYLGILNKYCLVCSTSGEKNVKKHECFKNYSYNKSSSSMETAIVVEGFMQSEEMHGVRYSKLVADGDSSVYTKILESRPYIDLTVQKIECRNHLLRNFCKKLTDLTTNTKLPVAQRKVLKENILRLRGAVSKAIKYRKEEDCSFDLQVNNLKQDLINAPYHVFGEHQNCNEYFCKGGTSTEKNFVDEFRRSGLFTFILNITTFLAKNSKSLIYDMTNNLVEHFNSLIAKKVSGKRINYFHGGSYKSRCQLAGIDYTTKGKAQSRTRELKNTPSIFTSATEKRRRRKVLLAREKRKQKKKVRKILLDDGHYGINCLKPDLEPDQMNKKKEAFLKTLEISQTEQQVIQERTIEQSESFEWMELRRKRISSSHFGRICNMLPYTSCEKFVSEMLYHQHNINTPAISWGREHELDAISSMECITGHKIKRCGLFIDLERPFLCSSPDGLINDDGVVEVKCPYSAREMTPDEAIFDKIINVYKIDRNGKPVINKKHHYYFQIQGQLFITKRKYCLFGIWTPKEIKIDKILLDEQFCDLMIPKLTKFYINCVLPELVDPRRRRSLAVRNPDYILEAQRKRKQKKTCRKQNENRF